MDFATLEFLQSDLGCFDINGQSTLVIDHLHASNLSNGIGTQKFKKNTRNIKLDEKQVFMGEGVETSLFGQELKI